jgi:hypothetical protein
VIADMQAIEGGRRGQARSKEYLSPKMGFRLESKPSVKTFHRANNGIYTIANDENVIGRISKASSAAISAKVGMSAPMDLSSDNDSSKENGSVSLTSFHSSEDGLEDSGLTGSG